VSAENKRLEQERNREANWKRWGPYLAERQWGSVREDYSKDQQTWDYFSHDDARSRAYRWGEDGLLGWTDRQCRLSFAMALWNGKDPILKERLFGLNGNEGNHGEDVKENYFYLASTPTHSYTKALYHYPQDEFPYAELVRENRARGLTDREFELEDTGIFDQDRYFAVETEVAKSSPNDLSWRITVHNRGTDAAPIHVLPTFWFRNVWDWEHHHEPSSAKPKMSLDQETGDVLLEHEILGRFRLLIEQLDGAGEAQWIFTENESNNEKLFNCPNQSPQVKDAFHRYLINGEVGAVSHTDGTKVTMPLRFDVPGGGSAQVRCRLFHEDEQNDQQAFEGFDELFAERIAEADSFYDEILPQGLTRDEEEICLQGYAGLLWSKQFYHYVVEDWMQGEPIGKDPAEARPEARNSDWSHFFARDILSMPDTWEYPWFAAWDSAFHMVPFAAIDPDFAKSQLLLLLREWYMHPNGQLPAYEWNFSDVNPPVHAWAVWRVYKIADEKGDRDLLFLERAFQKLLLNFNWWVNRKDVEGRHIFGGGFLGLDNIGVFDRSQELPGGGHLNQADGTAWMAFYCLNMLSISLELAVERPAYEDIASKFFEHFVSIADAINTVGGTGLWDDKDGFYYDQLIIDHKDPIPMKIRSVVGLLPLCAVTVLEQETIDALPGFKKRLEWFLENRKELAKYVTYCETSEGDKHRLLAIPSRDRLEKSLDRLVDEAEFLSPHGLRSLSKSHAEEPFVFQNEGRSHKVSYVSGESESWMFGGNSNWRGPVWFPVNYLIVEALEIYDHFYTDDFLIEYPKGSGNRIRLAALAEEIGDRLISLFLPDADGVRAFRSERENQRMPNSATDKDLLLFHEYFDGDTGRGLGATHQTGWTSLAVRLVRERAERYIPS